MSIVSSYPSNSTSNYVIFPESENLLNMKVIKEEESKKQQDEC